MTEPAAVLRMTGLLLGLWGMLGGLQWLADRPSWRADGPMGWDLQRLRRSRLASSSAARLLYAPAGSIALPGLQLLASAGLLVGMPLALTTAALALLAATALLLALRARHDGADKMALVVVGGALLQALGLWSGEPRFGLAGVLWTGGQLTIAYFTAGTSKLLLAPWRCGAAIAVALDSYKSGHRLAAPLIAHRGAAIATAWAIMLAEVLFPIALLAPPAWLGAVLAGFFLFHLAIAVIMGLNTYPWAFAAAFPSVLALGAWLRAALGWN